MASEAFRMSRGGVFGWKWGAGSYPIGSTTWLRKKRDVNLDAMKRRGEWFASPCLKQAMMETCSDHVTVRKWQKWFCDNVVRKGSTDRVSFLWPSDWETRRSKSFNCEMSRRGGEERFIVPIMTFCRGKLQPLFDDNGWVIGFTWSFLCFTNAITKVCFYLNTPCLSTMFDFLAAMYTYIELRWRYTQKLMQFFIPSAHYFCPILTKGVIYWNSLISDIIKMYSAIFETDGRTETEMLWWLSSCYRANRYKILTNTELFQCLCIWNWYIYIEQLFNSY
jgi:hypothetical protein